MIEAFKSTLEEVSRADLLLHLVDMANPLFEEQIRVIEKVLGEIGAGELPTLLVPNKIDLDLSAADGAVQGQGCAAEFVRSRR